MLKVTEQCLRCLSFMDGFMEGRVSSSPDNPDRLVSAVIMGWIEWGEERAGEQVRDLASGPGKGSKDLEKAVVGREEVDCRLPGQTRCLISLCLPTPQP